jgi:isocitrate/isopropylmalate dehydrogenase
MCLDVLCEFIQETAYEEIDQLVLSFSACSFYFFKQKKVTVVHKANIMKIADGVTCIAFQSLLLLILHI